MKINDLFFELSHEGRFQILLSLAHERKKHATLENELGLAGPEVSRHLKRLQNTSLVEKAPDGYYQPTSFGKMVYSIVPVIEKSLDFVDFINAHDFAPIPVAFWLQLGTESNIEIHTGTMANIELWTELIKGSHEFIWAITEQLQTSMVPIIQRKLETGTGLEIRAIIDRKLLQKFTPFPEEIPFDSQEITDRLDLFESVKLVSEANLSIMISERGALLFLRKENAIDYNQGIFSRAKAFIGWAKTIFDMIWHRAEPIRPSDLGEIQGQ